MGKFGQSKAVDSIEQNNVKPVNNLKKLEENIHQFEQQVENLNELTTVYKKIVDLESKANNLFLCVNDSAQELQKAKNSLITEIDEIQASLIAFKNVQSVQHQKAMSILLESQKNIKDQNVSLNSELTKNVVNTLNDNKLEIKQFVDRETNHLDRSIEDVYKGIKDKLKENNNNNKKLSLIIGTSSLVLLLLNIILVFLLFAK